MSVSVVATGLAVEVGQAGQLDCNGSPSESGHRPSSEGGMSQTTAPQCPMPMLVIKVAMDLAIVERLAIIQVSYGVATPT